MISPSLKEQVSIEIFTGTVKKNVQLRTAIAEITRNFQLKQSEKEKKMEELIRMIVMRMETELVEPDKVIISKYQEGTDLFIISKGECIVLILDEQSQQSQVKL